METSSVRSNQLLVGATYFCVQRDHDNLHRVLDCHVRPNTTAQDSHQSQIPQLGERPKQCDDYYEKYGFVPRPMGPCGYGRVLGTQQGMKRCGCETLDPYKHPELWEKYSDLVQKNVLSTLQSNPKEIRLVFFASGYLLLDFNLLNHLLNSDHIKEWRGNLYLEFIDSKYEIKDVYETIKTQTEKFTPLKASGATAGTLGGLALVMAGGPNEKKDRNIWLQLGGILLGGLSLWLGMQSFETVDDETKVVTPQMKDQSAEDVIRDFLEEASKSLPFEVVASFSSNTETSIQIGKNNADAVFGYDIEDAVRDFDHLREHKLNNNGSAIAVFNHSGTPCFLSGSRKNAFEVKILSGEKLIKESKLTADITEHLRNK